MTVTLEENARMTADRIAAKFRRVYFIGFKVSRTEAALAVELLRRLADRNAQLKCDADRFERQSESQDAAIQALREKLAEAIEERDQYRGQVNRLQRALDGVIREAEGVDQMCHTCTETLDEGGCPNNCPPF